MDIINAILTGKINENLLIEAIFTELLKKYHGLRFAKNDLKTMHWDGKDESHIDAFKFYWEYTHGNPEALVDGLNDQIAHQSSQLFNELK